MLTPHQQYLARVEKERKEWEERREEALHMPYALMQMSPRKYAVIYNIGNHYSGNDLIPVPRWGISVGKLDYTEAHDMVTRLNREYREKVNAKKEKD